MGEDSRRMKMIYLAISFLQLVCSKHFLTETEDTNEDSRETKEWGLNYHVTGYNGLRQGLGLDYNEELNEHEQQKSTKKIQNEILEKEKKKKNKKRKKKLKKVLGLSSETDIIGRWFSKNF